MTTYPPEMLPRSDPDETTDVVVCSNTECCLRAENERLKAELESERQSFKDLSHNCVTENGRLLVKIDKLEWDKSEQLRAERAGLRERVDSRLNDYLCEMQPGYDDSITGFNEAWDIVRECFEQGVKAMTDQTKSGAPLPEGHAFIFYTNYRGERRTYRIRPMRLYYGDSSHHPGRQWLLDAEDVTRGVIRTFAMQNVHKWDPAS
jgi:hypothetical protein